MTKPTPDPCKCGSRMFTRTYGLRMPDEHDRGDEVNEWVRGEGWKCVECGDIQLVREIPTIHGDDDNLDLPDAADRDMVREDE